MTYNPDLHEYRDDWGTLVPSVTQILGAYYEIDPRFYAPGSAERGTAVHDRCAAYCLGEWNPEASQGSEVDRYATHFARWIIDKGVLVLEVEKMIEGIVYAGRFDLLARIRGFVTMIDIKTGVPQPWHVVQLAGYMMVRGRARVAMNLYLTPEGYKEKWYTPAEVGKACDTFGLALHSWINKEGQGER